MSRSSDIETWQSNGPVTPLMGLNLVIVAAALLQWSLIGLYLAAPLTWATWSPLDANGKPELLRYPFVLLWALPLGGATLAQILKIAGKRRLAAAAAAFPLILLGVIVGWYYVTPTDWH